MARRPPRHPPLPPTPPSRRWRRGWVAALAAVAAAMAAFIVPHVAATVPQFYSANEMSVLWLSIDTEPGEIIYRLQASDADKDYPLAFDVYGVDSEMISVESDYQYGYVYLRERLNSRKNYTFVLTVTDTAGDTTEVVSRIIPTDGRTATSDIFLKYSASAVVAEDAKVGHVVTVFIVRSSKLLSNAVEFQILGSSAEMFKISSRLYSSDSYRGELVLQGQLDYEVKNLHALQICAVNPYTNEIYDTRNIICVGVSVLVEDRQDQPPIFIFAPPVTRITSKTLKDDELLKVEAVDGDRGVARELRFSMLASSTQYAPFFSINPRTGSITLQNTVNRLLEIMVTLEPILVKVTAVEMENENTRDPEETYSSTVEIAFVIMDSDMMIPKFVYEMYVGEVRENSPADTIVAFPNAFLKRGLKGMFAIELEGDDGIFTVEPNIVRNSQDFLIKVKNPTLLDYETRPRIEFKVAARQVSGTGQASSTMQVRINVLDLNDNIPVFSKQVYRTEIYENITAGTSIMRVRATDGDKGDFGIIKYTQLSGKLAEKLRLDEVSGLITCDYNNQDFDRELNPEVHLRVEAADNNGLGNKAMAQIILVLKDVNDVAPRFLKPIYTGVMKPDQNNLKETLQVQAVDDDAEEPNNKIRYSMDPSIFIHNFNVDSTTGVISVIQQLAYPQISGLAKKKREKRAYENDDGIITFSVTATDFGTPPLSTTVKVQIFRDEFVERFITFIYPKPQIEVRFNEDEIERMLTTITGGETEILKVEDYSTTDTSRSVVTALVRNDINAVVDIEKILNHFNGTKSLKQNAPQTVDLAELKNQRTAYLAWVVVLCLLLAFIILIIILCCFWPICPLYRERKKHKLVADENAEAERVSYIRVDERGNYRGGYEEERTWWDRLPTCCTEAATYFGVSRPKRGGGRLAWSGDERQKYWQLAGGSEGAILEDRAVVARRGPRDLILLEDLDEARLQQQGRVVRVDSRNSQLSQDPRRTFIIRDQRGNPRIAESLREGEHYVMEDIENTPRNMRMDDPRAMRMDDPRAMRMDDPRAMRMDDPRAMRMDDPRGMRMDEPRNAPMEELRGPPVQNASVDDDATYARQGNEQDLRLNASPHGAVLSDDWSTGRPSRPIRRSGVEPGGIMLTQEEMQRRALMHEDAGGGEIMGRHVEGQSVGVTPRSDREGRYEDGFVQTSMRYLHNGSPPQADVQIQTEDLNGGRDEHVVPRLRIRTPIEEETNSLLEAEGIRSSRREQQRARRNSQVEVEPAIHEDNISRRSMKTTQPANTLYQHTKASILRFETNRSKMDEETQKKESTISRRNSMSGTDGRRSSSVESRSMDGRRSVSQANLDGRRSNSQAALDGRHSHSQATQDMGRGTQGDSRASVERRGSLPSLETELERKAAWRSVSRRGSLGPHDLLDEPLPAVDGKSSYNSEYDEDYSPEDNEHRSGSRRQRKISQARYMEWYDKKQERSRNSKEGGKRSVDVEESDYIHDPGTRAVEGRDRRRHHSQVGDSAIENSSLKVVETREAAEGSETQGYITSEIPTGSSQPLRVPAIPSHSQDLPGDAKIQDGEEELRTIMDNEINLGVTQSSQMFDSDVDLETVAAARGRRKRNHLLEKKSIFTIAYDDMQTEQLRPESAATEP
ncbi:cadherin-86C-like isoform X2 [Homarus americanus]|uniref:cadherin-86C-like isoform X2 n=1 Tax=Homarus americanus TaxID=6706 RepID=UPI001C4887DE|nr:cadherin-86C-like isoform X2 [Homarus americanus]